MRYGRSAMDDAALVDFAAETGVRLLVTLGEGGVVLILETTDVVRIDAVVRDAVDTTGAGDAFVGAFAYALAAGMHELDAVALGMDCAGDSVTRPGTQTSFPNTDRAQELLESIGK